jgi:FkbM family methyltransferase
MNTQANYDILIEECLPFSLVKNKWEYRNLCLPNQKVKNGFETFSKIFGVKKFIKLSDGNIIKFASESQFVDIDSRFLKNIGFEVIKCERYSFSSGAGLSLEFINEYLKKSLNKVYYESKDSDLHIQHYISENIPDKLKFNILIQPLDGTLVEKFFVDKINQYDLILTPSENNKKQLINSGVYKRVVVIPNFYIEEESNFIKTNKKKNEKFTFYSESSHITRKNINNLVLHFIEAFKGNELSDKVKLVVKISTNKEKEEKLQNLINSYSDKIPEIVIINKKLEQDELNNLWLEADCYICLSYMEGFCIPALKAVSCNIPVIALDSKISGYMDFLDETNSLLVKCNEINIISDSDSLLINSKNSKWEEPDYEDYKLKLSEVINKKLSFKKDLKNFKLNKVMQTYLENIFPQNFYNSKENDFSFKKLKVRFAGYIKSASGYGNAARNYLESIMQLPFIELFVDSYDDYTTNNNLFTKFDSLIKNSPDYVDIDIMVSTPKNLPIHPNSKKRIFCMYWETDILNNFIIEYFNKNKNDIIVSPSDYLRDILVTSGIDNEFVKIQHWHLPNSKIKRKKHNEKVIFYTIAQNVTRKNLKEMFECYLEEFTINDNVKFVAKISRFSEDLTQFLDYINSLKTKDSPELEFITDFLTDDEIKSLHQNSDVFVLAQHSEGWGIPHIEALLSGNPLVTVNYGSLKEFVNSKNSYEIDYKIGRNECNLGNYPKESNWAIPSRESIKEKIRLAYDDFINKNVDINFLSNLLSLKRTTQGWRKLFQKNFENSQNWNIPKISIITSMKNANKFLNQFLLDVTRQTIFKSHCEWIIIDVNETEDDYEIIKPFLKEHKNIIYKKSKDNGIYATWNEAISLSSGEFITNMNCDDRRHPDNLKKMAKLLSENDDISLVYCDSYIVNQANINWESLPKNCERYNFSEFENSNLLYENTPHNNPMWRRDLHLKYGLFDEKYKSAGDWDFWVRCWHNGEKFKKHPEVLGIYYFNPTGISTNPNNRTSFVEKEENLIRTKYSKFDFVVVSHNHLNCKDGTSIYLKNMISNENFLNIFSFNGFSGGNHIKINYNHSDYDKIFNENIRILNTDKILSVPYFIDDVVNSLQVKKKCPDAKLVTYLMDDQNITVNIIPDELLSELLHLSDLRFCISKEMCREYKKKYDLDFYFLPPLVKSNLMCDFLIKSESINNPIIIGNIWNEKWLDNLRILCKEAGIRVDFYGNHSSNVKFDICALEKDGINFKGFCEENVLIDTIRNSPYAIVLSPVREDDRNDLRLSLFSKIIYLTSTGNIPILILGSPENSSVKFVEEMEIGLNSDYDIDDFRQAINDIQDKKLQEKFRKNSYYIANQLNIDYHCITSNSRKNALDWIWKSCEIGKPINNKYENLGKCLKSSKVIISPVEINNLHGTGPLIKRVVGGEDNTLVILSKLQYDFKNDFGDLVLHIDSSKIERRTIIDRLGNNEIEQILCVPYFKEDLITSITLHDEFNVPMGCYIMDDQNIVSNNIPDDLMFEFLNKCEIRFVTHAELRNAYENKYKLKFYIIPQVVPDELINKEEYDCEKNSNGAIIGSIWTYNWLKKLCQTLKESNVKVDWYGNNKYPWLNETDEELISYGLNPVGLLSEEELSKKLKSYPYVIVPYGTLEDDDDAKNLTKLSLPGRIIFASATANIPIIVMGSEKCSAAQFVTKFGIGTVCDYNGNSLIEAINFIKENEKELRKNAFLIANNFSSEGIEDFLWQSIRWYKRAFDMRFESIFNEKYEINSYSQYGDDLVIYDYFKGRTGNFLDIGANDGVTISNTYKLLKNGWSGTYIEGSKNVFDRLKINTLNTNTQCLNYFLSDKNESVTLYSNSKLFDNSININNIDLLTTIDRNCYLKTKDWGEFEEIECESFIFHDIEEDLKFNEYQMISIDIEGLDYEVLSQINLEKYKTEMIVIEYDGDEEKRKKIINYCNIYHLNNILFDNRINLIITK